MLVCRGARAHVLCACARALDAAATGFSPAFFAGHGFGAKTIDTFSGTILLLNNMMGVG